MMVFLARLLEFIVITWLVRFVIRNVFGGGHSSRTAAEHPPASARSPEPAVITGEMKKDPQCGTYVSTELSLQSRHDGEVIHFCSRECQEQFFQTRASKPA